MNQTTPLYEKHLARAGKMVPFAGFLLPVQYDTGILAEHMAVRQAAGLFDVSHMGELVLEGPGALQTINYLLTNDFTNLTPGQVRYSPMCGPQGGIIDDLVVYCLAEDKFMLVVNAANRQKDVDWISQHLQGEVDFRDISADIAQLALQGPAAKAMMQTLVKPEELPVKYYRFVEHSHVGDIPCLISRTGYTGEHGYEIYTAPADAPALWDLLLEAGQTFGLIPCGLGARDTLRFEASLPLYGNEMTDDITPLQVGLHFAVKLDKEDFIGKEALLSAPITRKRMGAKVTGRGIVREGAPLLLNGKEVGITTSGTHVPSQDTALAMVLVDSSLAQPGQALLAQVRKREIPIELVELPFIKK